MKLTLTNVRKLKADSTNRLAKHVWNYVIDQWRNYSDKTNIFKDVLEHGCVSGIVSELIYYSDTLAFYKKYRDEINDLLSETMHSTGCFSLHEIFGENGITKTRWLLTHTTETYSLGSGSKKRYGI